MRPVFTAAQRVLVFGAWPLLLPACAANDHTASRRRPHDAGSIGMTTDTTAMGEDAAHEGAETDGTSMPRPQPLRDAATTTVWADASCTMGAQPGLELVALCADADAAAVFDAAADAAQQSDGAAPGDAATDAPSSAETGAPVSDAGGEDAGVAPDEGICASDHGACSLGRAEVVVGSGVCTLSGDDLWVEREMCEVCGEQAHILGYSLAVMDCDTCEQVYGTNWGAAFFDTTLAANACRSREDHADISRSRADAECIDVYATVNSGEPTASGGLLSRAVDRVRVCQCDRTTDTCISCVDGSCSMH